MKREVTAVYGDCPATFRRVQQLLGAAGAELQWDDPSEAATFADALRSVKRTGLALVGHARGTGDGLSPAVLMRDELGVYAQHRPIRPLPGIPTRHQDVDLIVVRETTEDVYAHLEHESLPGVFESLKVTTEEACRRIARHAFEVAQQTGRDRVTIVHKANIMKLSDGMFLRTAKKVAQDFPEIRCDDVIVDALCMKLVIAPGPFEVLLCGNLFGDIVSDLCAGLVGGPSNAPSINFADNLAVFTAGQGDDPQFLRTEYSSPLPILLPAIHLLRHIGQSGEAERLHDATASALEAGIRPRSLGGEATREELCRAIEARLA